MAGNAHRNRNRRRHRCKACLEGNCKYAIRPKFGEYANKNGHRRNPARGKKQHKRKVKILDFMG